MDTSLTHAVVGRKPIAMRYSGLTIRRPSIPGRYLVLELKDERSRVVMLYVASAPEVDIITRLAEGQPISEIRRSVRGSKSAMKRLHAAGIVTGSVGNPRVPPTRAAEPHETTSRRSVGRANTCPTFGLRTVLRGPKSRRPVSPFAVESGLGVFKHGQN